MGNLLYARYWAGLSWAGDRTSDCCTVGELGCPRVFSVLSGAGQDWGTRLVEKEGSGRPHRGSDIWTRTDSADEHVARHTGGVHLPGE